MATWATYLARGIPGVSQRVQTSITEKDMYDELINLTSQLSLEVKEWCFHGGREMVELERAHELLSNIQNNVIYHRVVLSNKSYSPAAARVIAARLSALDTIKELDFSDMIAGRPEEDALITLSEICNSVPVRTLRYLDLSDNALGEKGIHACRNVISNQPHLEEIYFCNNGLSSSSMELLTNILVAEGTPLKVHTLHFYNNMSGPEGAVALARLLKHCPLLTNFRFSGTRALRAGSRIIAEALLPFNKFHFLDLADNMFSEEITSILVQVLRNQPHLRHLNLKDAGLEDAGVQEVCNALLESAQEIEHLDLSANDITSESIDALVTLISARKRTLRVLLLDDNAELGSTGVKQLTPILAECYNLEILSLNNDSITASGAIQLVQTIQHLPKLSHLNLNMNLISAKGLEEIHHILSANGKEGILGDMSENMEEESDEDNDDN